TATPRPFARPGAGSHPPLRGAARRLIRWRQPCCRPYPGARDLATGRRRNGPENHARWSTAACHSDQMPEQYDRAAERIWRALPAGTRDALERGLPRTDLQSLLIDVARTRASQATPADLMR